MNEDHKYDEDREVLVGRRDYTHYEDAELLLAELKSVDHRSQRKASLLAEAQLHATLALVDAVVYAVAQLQAQLTEMSS